MRRTIPFPAGAALVIALLAAVAAFQLPANAGSSRLERRVAKLETKVASLSPKVSALQTTVASQATSISTLNARVSALETWRNDHVTNNNSWFSSIDTRLDSLEARTQKLSSAGAYLGDISGTSVNAPSGFGCWGAVAVWSGTDGRLLC